MSAKKGMLFILLVLMMMVAACGGTTNDSVSPDDTDDVIQDPPPPPANEVKKEEDPVTVQLYLHTRLTDEDFEKMNIDEILMKKHPHITLERIPPQDYNKMLSSGVIPDLVFTFNGMLLEFSEVGLASDLSPLVKEAQIDTAQFEKSIIDSMKNDSGELLAIPFSDQIRALYYNKSIFDKFAKNYPEDGMTWDETYELARQVTGMDGGIQYQGLDPGALPRLALQNTVDFIDYKTSKPNVNSDEMKYVFDILQKIWTIPGNTRKTDTKLFVGNQTMAMYAYVSIFDLLEEPTRNGLDWDMAQYPSMPGRPDLSHPVDAHIFTVPVTSKHQAAAMDVIEVMISEEVQMNSVSKTARVSSLSDPKYKENFATELGFIQNKNIEGIFKSKPFYSPLRSKYYANARSITEAQFKHVLNGEKDINTALREAEEEINQYVKSQEGN